MKSKLIIIFVFYIFLCLHSRHTKAQTWIRAGYYLCSDSETTPISDINSSLFTHLICGFAVVDPTSYQLSFSPSDEKQFSTFTPTVKQKNPSVTTLLSIWDDKETGYSTFSSMARNASYRKSFIDSSIKIARHYGFQGLDLSWIYPSTRSDIYNMGILFCEWRTAISMEVNSSNQSQLILTSWVQYSPSISSGSYPIESIKQYLDWVHVSSANYSSPKLVNLTSAHAALRDPNISVNTDYGIKAWLDAGLPANKLVLCIPYYGYAWTLVNADSNGIGAAASGPAITTDGFMSYKDIKNYIKKIDPYIDIIYNEIYVVNYCTIGTNWIGFDGVEAVKAKVSYAEENGLLGYYVWQVSYDDNWLLSQAAAVNQVDIHKTNNNNGHNKMRLFVIVFCTTAAVILLLGIFAICYCWRTKLKFKGMVDSAKQSIGEVNRKKVDKAAAAGDFNSSVSKTKTMGMMIP